MGLFRPYERTETDKSTRPASSLTPKAPVEKPAAKKIAVPRPAPETPTVDASDGKKNAPTPTRKAAEAARMERLHPSLTKREARKKSRMASRIQAEENWQKLERTSERALLRDYVDSRWTVVEFMLPMMLVFLAVTMLISLAPQFALWVTFGLWGFLIASLLDIIRLWRGFKAELATRQPKSSTRGLLMYLINRAMMIRRFRQPRPRLSRGDSY